MYVCVYMYNIYVYIMDLSHDHNIFHHDFNYVHQFPKTDCDFHEISHLMINL